MIQISMILLFLVSFCIIPCTAYSESGAVEYQIAENKAYTTTLSGGWTDSIYDKDRIYHRFTDAKILYRVIDKSTFSRLSVDIPANNYTSFFATVDSIYYGSGYVNILDNEGDVWFDIQFTNVNSSYANSLCGNHYIDFIYDESVFSRTSGGGVSSRLCSPPSTSIDKPTTFMYSYSGFYEPKMHGNIETYTAYSVHYINNYEYVHNESTGFATLDISKNNMASDWSVFNYDQLNYFSEGVFSSTDLYNFFTFDNGVYINVTFNFEGGTSIYKTIEVGSSSGIPSAFNYTIITGQNEYAPGDTVNVTYTTDQKGTIQVVKTISEDIYHSIGFISGATNATWQFYIAGNEPYGFYDVYLLDSSNSILDTVRYSLLPTTSSLDILQSSVDLHETFVVFAQTVNESILSIEDPDGVEVWNESIDALMYDYIYYTPTIKTGIYTAYLYDDATLNDTVMVYSADPPIIDDPLDPVTNGSIVIEDVLDPDESMTEYFDDKFRGFAPTAWSIFLLSVVLWLMAIVSSFGGSGKRR